ncbi:MAG: hypothetical protein R3Y13_05115 [bacterium]
MIKIETKEIKISDTFKRKIEMIGRFTTTDPKIVNGEILNVIGTNIAYTKPHQIIIDNNIYLIFEESEDVFINSFNNKIKFKDLENYIKTNKNLG